MGDLCSRVVRAFGGSWGAIGWILWLIALAFPFLANSLLLGPGFAIVVVLPLLLWWLVDLVDQEAPPWMIPIGLALISYGVYMGIFADAIILLWSRGSMVLPWLYYWMRVRE